MFETFVGIEGKFELEISPKACTFNALESTYILHFKHHLKLIHLDKENKIFMTLVKCEVDCKNNSSNPTVIKSSDVCNI